MPETELTVAGVMLHQLILEHFLELFVDQKVNLYTYKNCCSGKKLVDWVTGQSSVNRSRNQVIAMWQALLVDGVIKHGKFIFDLFKVLWSFSLHPNSISCILCALLYSSIRSTTVELTALDRVVRTKTALLYTILCRHFS